MAKLTKKEFEKQWARGACMEIGELEGFRLVAIPCDCGKSNCQGWFMQSKSLVKAEEGVIPKQIKKLNIYLISYDGDYHDATATVIAENETHALTVLKDYLDTGHKACAYHFEEKRNMKIPGVLSWQGGDG